MNFNHLLEQHFLQVHARVAPPFSCSCQKAVPRLPFLQAQKLRGPAGVAMTPAAFPLTSAPPVPTGRFPCPLVVPVRPLLPRATARRGDLNRAQTLSSVPWRRPGPRAAELRSRQRNVRSRR